MVVPLTSSLFCGTDLAITEGNILLFLRCGVSPSTGRHVSTRRTRPQNKQQIYDVNAIEDEQYYHTSVKRRCTVVDCSKYRLTDYYLTSSEQYFGIFKTRTNSLIKTNYKLYRTEEGMGQLGQRLLNNIRKIWRGTIHLDFYSIYNTHSLFRTQQKRDTLKHVIHYCQRPDFPYYNLTPLHRESFLYP